MFWCLYPQQSSPGPRAAWVGEEGRKQGRGGEKAGKLGDLGALTAARSQKPSPATDTQVGIAKC